MTSRDRTAGGGAACAGARGLGLRALVVGVGVVLGGVALVGAVRLFRPPPPVPTRFPSAARARVDALRDRLARGLLSLRMPQGDWSPRTDADRDSVDPLDRAETTAIAVAGLAAARRMGADVPGLAGALREAKGVLAGWQTRAGGFGVSRKPNRGTAVSAVSSAILAFTLAPDPVDTPLVVNAGKALVFQAQLGTLPAGWVAGVATRALVELVDEGYATAIPDLGRDDVVSLLPSLPVELGRRLTDSHVAQAFVVASQTRLGARADPYPSAVFARVLADPPAYTGDETDLASWVLSAWLAAGVPGGEAWFERVLPELERAPDAGGVIRGAFYGSPASRTADALLILYEGTRPVAK